MIGRDGEENAGGLDGRGSAGGPQGQATKRQRGAEKGELRGCFAVPWAAMMGHPTLKARGGGGGAAGGGSSSDLLSDSRGGGRRGGSNGNGGGLAAAAANSRWVRRALGLVVVLHLLLIAAVLWSSPFDGHRRNDVDHGLPMEPQQLVATAAELVADDDEALGGIDIWASGAEEGDDDPEQLGLIPEEEGDEEEDEEEDGEDEEEDEEGNEEEEAKAQKEEEEEKEGAGEEEEQGGSVPALPLGAPSLAGAGGRRRRRPAAFEQCGHWQEEYMALHRRIVAGEAPERYLVAVVYKGGLADQLVGIVSAFYWALLTRRAFQITTGHQQLPPFEAAFDAPFINWTRPLDPAEYTRHLYHTHKGDREFPDSVDTDRFASIYTVNNNERSDDLYMRGNLHERFPEHPVVFVAGNRGRSFRLFDNPHHREELTALGLRPETAFGCAFRFLFAPNAATRASHAEEFRRLARVPPPKKKKKVEKEEEEDDKEDKEENVLRIGIQVRVGDFIFNNVGRENQLQLEDYMSYFECATQIENHRRQSEDTKVLWYLISDSARLRQLALEKFGPEKLLTQTAKVHHIGKCGKEKDCSDDAKAFAIAEAAGDMMAMAMTDYQVLTENSGFGKVAAAISMRWHSVWFGGTAVHRKSQAKKKKKHVRCGPRGHLSYEKMADKWSGI